MRILRHLTQLSPHLPWENFRATKREVRDALGTAYCKDQLLIRCKGQTTNMKILTRFTQVLLLLLTSAALLAAQSSKESAEYHYRYPYDRQMRFLPIPNGSGMMRRLSYPPHDAGSLGGSDKRMVRLNGLDHCAREASHILRYLSNNNDGAGRSEPISGKPNIAPSERRKTRTASRRSCNAPGNYCHTIGRVLGQRRPRDEYEKLANTHIAMFPGAENVYRPTLDSESGGCPVALGVWPDGGQPALIVPAVAKVETKLRWTSLSITGKETSR